jgi:Zinc knuckle
MPIVWVCFRCGEPGHIVAQCPTRKRRKQPAAPQPPAGAEEGKIYHLPPPVPARLPAVPPTLEYLQERQRLGMPSNAEALAAACPWCHAATWAPCHIPGTREKRSPHPSRLDASVMA